MFGHVSWLPVSYTAHRVHQRGRGGGAGRLCHGSNVWTGSSATDPGLWNSPSLARAIQGTGAERNELTSVVAYL